MSEQERTAALVDVDLDAVAMCAEGALVDDPQGNQYVVFHNCTSIKDAVYGHMLPWLELNGGRFIDGEPWEDDPRWVWTAFKDLVAYDPDSGEAAVCFNYRPIEAVARRLSRRRRTR